jgi:hypothetical protein
MPDVSERGRAVATVLGAMAVILLALTRVTGMMGDAWQHRQLVFNAVHFLFGSLGLNIDVAVVFPAGVIAAWLVLFMLDGHKTIQGLVLLFVALPTFLVTLSRRGEWIGTVDWLRYGWSFGLGAVVGLVTGGLGAKGGNRWDLRRFPTASKALYAVVSLAAVVAFVEFHLAYTSPILWNLQTGELSTRPIGPVSLRGGSLVLDAVSTAALVVVLNLFTQYSDSTTMLVVGPDEATEAKAKLVGGLYNHAQGRGKYSGVQPIADADPTGARRLNDATTARSEAALPDDVGTVAFKFREAGPLNRRNVVRVDSHRPPRSMQATRLENRVETRRTAAGRVAHYLSRGVQLLLPGWLLDRFRSDAGQFLERLDGANTLLLVVPFGSLVDRERYEAGEYETLADVVDTSAEYLQVYDRLCSMYRDVPGHETVVVVTGAVELREMLTAEQDGAGGPIVFHADEFRDEVAAILGLEHCTVLPFDRGFERGETVKGAGAVLDRI